MPVIFRLFRICFLSDSPLPLRILKRSFIRSALPLRNDKRKVTFFLQSPFSRNSQYNRCSSVIDSGGSDYHCFTHVKIQSLLLVPWLDKVNCITNNNNNNNNNNNKHACAGPRK